MIDQRNLLGSYERRDVAESVVQFLCYFASGNLHKPLPQTGVNWDDLFQEVTYNGLVGLVYYYLQNSPHASHIPVEFAGRIQQSQRLIALRSAVLNRHIQTAIGWFNTSGIEYLAVKGPILAYHIYPHPTMRIFNDLDIIVRERDWTRMYDFMVANGFEQVGILPPAHPKIAQALVIHESKFIHTQSKLRVEIHYDDFLESGLVSRDVEGFWRRARDAYLDKVTCRTLSIEDHLLYLCTHVHYHAYTRLNWLSDIAHILRNTPTLNWEAFTAVAVMEEAQIPAFYTLRLTRELLDVHIPEDVLRRLRPDWLRRRLHEIWMPHKKVAALKPISIPGFRFHFRPFFKRALPSILVMGRRREKIRILFQVIKPSEDWLRRYYRLDDNVWIAPYYFRRLLHMMSSWFRTTAE